VKNYRPDEVWWMPNERFLICKPGLKPVGLPEGKEEAADGRAPAGFAAQASPAEKRDGARK
jgi:hypothetical protein